MPFAVLEGTPAQCILVLAIVLVACYSLALLLPGVRMELNMSAYRGGPGLILLQDPESFGGALPTISQVQYRMWQRHKQENFDELAFYRVGLESLTNESTTPEHRKEFRWNVAHASLNFFELLRLPIRFAEQNAESEGDLPSVILSDTGWRKGFGADPHVAGRTLLISGRMVRIAGVAPDGPWGLPGNVDAWLLESEPRVVTGHLGYAVARLTASGAARMFSRSERIVVHISRISEDDLLGVSLHQGVPGPLAIFLFAFLLSLLGLPAITPFALSDYSVGAHKLSWSQRLFRWGFLAAKIALVISVAYFASVDLAYGPTSFASATSIYIEIFMSFSICLFGLRWALRDQRQRCPICLRRVAQPARVGLASRTFLAWNGIELMCLGGHSLLHVPELPTSWFGAPRWVYLDSSWEFLFGG
jgi:hypothetical protein